MQDMVTRLIQGHTAKSVPLDQITTQLHMDGRWDDLDCPDKGKVKNFVLSHFNEIKKTADHALQREGKRSYTKISLKWLKSEDEHRKLDIGR